MPCITAVTTFMIQPFFKLHALTPLPLPHITNQNYHISSKQYHYITTNQNQRYIIIQNFQSNAPQYSPISHHITINQYQLRHQSIITTT